SRYRSTRSISRRANSVAQTVAEWRFRLSTDSLLHRDNHQRRVVLQSFTRKGCDGLQYRLLKFSWRRVSISQQQLDETFVAELLSSIVAGLGDSVGDQHQSVARQDVDFSFIVLGVGKYTQHHTALGQSRDRTVATNQNRRHMTGIAITQRSARRIENRVEECGEPIGFGVFQSNAV